jgi:hypothetical protein
MVNYVWVKYVIFKPVYALIAWTSLTESIMIVAISTAGAILLHVVVWLLSWLKLWLLISDHDKEETSDDET